MSNFNYYSAEKAYGELYLQFPKVFLYSDKYRDLSNDAKIAYMVFKDRFQYSIKNDWIDENGYIYFVFTNKELELLLNCSKNKVTKIKKELEEKNILLQVSQGFDPKRKRNLPNRLYLADLDVDAHEVYKYQNVEQSLRNSGLPKNGTRLVGHKSLDISGLPKNGTRQKSDETLENTGLPKRDPNQYKDINHKDNKDIKESYAEQNEVFEQSLGMSEKNKELENQLIDQFIEDNGLHSMFGHQVIDLMKIYSFGNFATFETYYSKLYYAYKSAMEELDFKFTLDPISTSSCEAMRAELKSAFQRAIQQYKLGNIKTDFNNYLFGVFKSTFLSFGESILNERERNDKDLPPVPLFNWIDDEPGEEA